VIFRRHFTCLGALLFRLDVRYLAPSQSRGPRAEAKSIDLLAFTRCPSRGLGGRNPPQAQNESEPVPLRSFRYAEMGSQYRNDRIRPLLSPQVPTPASCSRRRSPPGWSRGRPPCGRSLFAWRIVTLSLPIRNARRRDPLPQCLRPQSPAPMSHQEVLGAELSWGVIVLFSGARSWWSRSLAYSRAGWMSRDDA
jgi:hypothetical protein